MELDKAAIGQRIRHARIAAGYTKQGDFAAAVGVTKANANRWEMGKSTPNPEQLLLICRLTNVSQEQILLGVGYPASPPGGAVRSESLIELFGTEEGKRLSQRQKFALAEFLGDVEVDVAHARVAIGLLSRAVAQKKKPPK